MLNTTVVTSGVFILAAILGTAALFAQPSGPGKNWAMIYQGSPQGSDATIDVKQRDGATTIERHDTGGNTAIIQQR